MDFSTIGRKIKTATLLTAFSAFAAHTASAGLFTAVTSGNFSSGSTWAGNVAPSFNNTGDNIIINTGVTVNLDQTATFNGVGSTLAVNGAITSSSNMGLVLTSTTLSGAGSINVDSIVLTTASGLTYTGTVTAKNMTSLGATIATAATINVTNRLRMMSGVFTLNSGTLNLSSGTTIVMSGGIFYVGGGATNFTNSYSLRYEGSNSLSTGLEAGGTGLTNIEVATATSNSVSLTSDMNVRGMLTLTSGSLRLNGSNMSFTGNGDFSASGNGSIVSASNSNITISSTNSFSGGLRFRSDSNTVNNMTVNMGSASATARLGSRLNVAGTFSLQAGRMDIDSNMLALTGTGSGSFSGGSSSSYIITRNGGRLGMNVASNASTTYHVGTTSRYAPAMLTSNSGNASGMLSVGVSDSVRAQGTSGSATSATRKMVNATWNVYSANSSNININLTTMWSSNMEVNGFNRSQAYISHYTNGNWDMTASASATTAANGMYSLSRNNITSLSPFAVYDRDAFNTTGVKNVVANGAVRIYPNPATNVLHFDAPAGVSRVDIYNTTGTLVKSVIVTGNSVAVDELAAGNYYAYFSNSALVSVQQFTKQ